jgi:hypothetical protein
LSQADLDRLRLNGRATEPQFAQNPLPVVEAMGYAMAEHHGGSTEGLAAQTPAEVEAALELAASDPMPHPYTWATGDTVRAMLRAGVPADLPALRTHGAPIVANAVLVDSVVTFEDGELGADPAERDLAIALRSIAETFSPEATRTFLDAYEDAGGQLPNAEALDWYALLAAFR